MGSSKSGGSSSGDQTITVRYAPYLETHHQSLLTYAKEHYLNLVEDSPYTDYTAAEIEDAFFGVGYVMSSFPSMYDMYGKFMAGLDIESLWNQEFDDVVNSEEVGNLVGAEADILDDDIETNILPRFLTGLRDINAVQTSSFVIGKAIIEDARVKSIAKFDRELRYNLIPYAVDKWKAHLTWNQTVITTYAEVMKLYYASKRDMEDLNRSMVSMNTLWPFTVLDYYRITVGTLHGATSQTSSVAGSSKLGSALSGALSGGVAGGALWGGLAASGIAMSNPVGMGLVGAGAVLGGLAGIL